MALQRADILLMGQIVHEHECACVCGVIISHILSYTLTLVHNGSPPVTQQPVWNAASLTGLAESLASLLHLPALNQLLKSKRLQTAFHTGYYLSFALRTGCPVSTVRRVPDARQLVQQHQLTEREGAFSCHGAATFTGQMEGRSLQPRSHCWPTSPAW